MPFYMKINDFTLNEVESILTQGQPRWAIGFDKNTLELWKSKQF